MNITQLPPLLAKWAVKIEGVAASYGLDFYPTIFEMVDFETMNEVAAYGGFPTRYRHWRWGMEYESLSKGYRYGLSKIYELVINNNPCYAYLLESNAVVDQKLVMAHVFAHCDFFKNNISFSRTNRKMMDETANHAARIDRYIEDVGLERVETFLDACLTIEDLVDPHAQFIQRRRTVPKDGEGEPATVKKLRSKAYMDPYINPPEFLEAQQARLDEEARRMRSFPEEPERDVLLFLMEHAPLERWQRDILSIVREEAYYFAPQGQTKIMNEGWASFWHSKMMTEKLLTVEELIDYADHHSGTVAMSPGRLNPYKIGIELFRDIEERWNKGRFGKEYDECDSWDRKRHWDTGLRQGRDKIFEVRKIHNDVTFIDSYLTEDFCRQQKLFTFAMNDKSQAYEIQSREFRKVREMLLFQLTNHGRPFIYVKNGNHANRGELLLWHRYEGVELKRDYAEDTLKNLEMIWGRPVHIETVMAEADTLISCVNGQVSEAEITG
jgi:stage V sporulation protein R